MIDAIVYWTVYVTVYVTLTIYYAILHNLVAELWFTVIVWLLWVWGVIQIQLPWGNK